jgi:hypothetical protein
MGARKIKDIAVKTGEYTDRQGQTKGRWQNVGALMKNDDNSVFIILERWFNPAGAPDPQGRGSVLLSCFDLRDDGPAQGGGNGGGAGGYGAPMQPPQQPQRPPADLDDEIPF